MKISPINSFGFNSQSNTNKTKKSFQEIPNFNTNACDTVAFGMANDKDLQQAFNFVAQIFSDLTIPTSSHAPKNVKVDYYLQCIEESVKPLIKEKLSLFRDLDESSLKNTICKSERTKIYSKKIDELIVFDQYRNEKWIKTLSISPKDNAFIVMVNDNSQKPFVKAFILNN